MPNSSKEWHEKMHGHGIWHGHCDFCKAKRPNVRKVARQVIAEDRVALDALAEAERILAKPKKRRK